MNSVVPVMLCIYGISGFAANDPNLAATEPNTLTAESAIHEQNIIEAEAIESLSAIQLTPAQGILRPRYSLLPLKTELTDEASLPIYFKLFQTDPNHPELDPDFTQIEQFLKMTAEQTDMILLGKELERCAEKLKLLKKASLCRNVQWPLIENIPIIDTEPMMLSLAVYPSVESQLRQDEMKDQPVILTPSEYLDFLADIQRYGKLPALKARYHILNLEYETAAEWLEIGLSISRQMTVHSNSHLGTTATDQAAVMFRQVELWVQTPDSPSLYRSLQDLPKPFLKVIDFKPLVQMESKQRYARNQMFEVAPYLDISKPMEDANNLLPDCTSEQFERMSRQVDRFVAILECLEGLRYYAALYDGILPDTLDEVTELRLPTDPVTNGIFVYYKESNNYILRTSDADIIPATLGFGYTIRMTPISKD
jgi:hypothetical protein